jgi:hypothetical protein
LTASTAYTTAINMVIAIFNFQLGLTPFRTTATYGVVKKRRTAQRRVLLTFIEFLETPSELRGGRPANPGNKTHGSRKMSRAKARCDNNATLFKSHKYQAWRSEFRCTSINRMMALRASASGNRSTWHLPTAAIMPLPHAQFHFQRFLAIQVVAVILWRHYGHGGFPLLLAVVVEGIRLDQPPTSGLKVTLVSPCDLLTSLRP